MSMPKQLVSVVIPCYNEVSGIAKVIRGFHQSGLAKTCFDFDIIVVDNASTDGTAKAAKQAGARVFNEKKQGKGFAIRTGFTKIPAKAEYVVMLDGDGTYSPEEALRMLEPLHHDFCDAVVGSRLGGKLHGESMTYLNRAGNWGFTHLTRLIYKVNVTDVLSGYFAWKRSVIDELLPNLQSHGFSIEMEMITKMSRMGFEMYSVPISYRHRKGETSLRPFQDGMRILTMLARNIAWALPGPKQDGATIKDEA